MCKTELFCLVNDSKTDIEEAGTQGNLVLLMHVGVHKPQEYDFLFVFLGTGYFCVALAVLEVTLYVDQASLSHRDLLG